MNAIRPVASAAPPGVKIIQRDFIKPRWESCDGIKSTYSWDDVTVDVEFDSNGLPDAQVFAYIARALRHLGWVYETDSNTGAWYWHRRINNETASIQLLGGATVDTPNPWALQAAVPAATHPAKGC